MGLDWYSEIIAGLLLPLDCCSLCAPSEPASLQLGSTLGPRVVLEHRLSLEKVNYKIIFQLYNILKKLFVPRLDFMLGIVLVFLAG